MSEVIIKSCINRRSDCNLCLWEKCLNSFCHNVRCCVTKYCQSLLISCCKDVQFTVFIKNCTKVYNLSVYFSCTGCACKSFTDVKCNVDH